MAGANSQQGNGVITTASTRVRACAWAAGCGPNGLKGAGRLCPRRVHGAWITPSNCGTRSSGNSKSEQAKNLDATPIKSELAKLDQQIDRGVGNLLLLDPANIPAAQKLLEAKRERRATLQSQLDDATGSNKPTNLPD